MLHYKTLEDIDLFDIYDTFLEAFSDYVIPMQLSVTQFQQLLKRRGFSKSTSIGAFNGSNLVAVLFTGTRVWHEKITTYTIGLGVIPEFRGQQIATKLYQYLFSLKEHEQTEQYLLEVITSNEKAIALYQKSGFNIVRELRCYNLPRDHFPTYIAQPIDISHELPDINPQDFWSKSPAWQYSCDTLKVDADSFIYAVFHKKQQIVGYAIMNPLSGDIMQIGVLPAYRRQGIATSLITELSKHTEADHLSLSNIDAENICLIAFLCKLGFNYTLSQYEMILDTQKDLLATEITE